MTFESQFGLWERLLHRLAFRTGFSQMMLSDLEDRIFAGDTSGVMVGGPVFISGLPRSGTTILLQLLYDTGRFATHTYQEMPFLLCPLLWSRFARRFTVERDPRERAHGDGLEISTRSPEAFEEVVWKRFWRGHYKPDRIEPWTLTDHNAEFEEFFERHMVKIIAIRGTDRSNREPLRYLSKNNVNIARLGGLPGPLRRGIFVIPFRDPFQHAASMLRQHRRFSNLHMQDRFSRQYMEGIGHHDFGLSLRPINFGGWVKRGREPNSLEFWLRYWNAAYRHVLIHHSPSTRLISYYQLTTEPQVALHQLAELLELSGERLLAMTGRLRPPRKHEVSLHDVPAEVSDEALAIYDELRQVDRAGSLGT